MIRLSYARSFGALIAAASVLVSVSSGCSSDPPTATKTGDYCASSTQAATKCKEPSGCDDALRASCSTLSSSVSPTILTAANDCLESGVCGPASCLGRALNGAKPTAAHATLATNFCTFCAPDVEDCEAQFYAKKSKMPGVLVLPYSEAVVAAVDEACTGNQNTCRAQFVSCATETIALVVGESLDPAAAECVLQAFTRDEQNTGPGGGPTVTTCTPANCDGCCRDDKCEKGTSEATCGVGAAACQICRGAQLCTNGVCKEPCGPNNCPGCCDGDECLPGTAGDTCGAEGLECVRCETIGASHICSNHQCIDGSCQATCTTGCCSAAGCQPGTKSNACGTGGEGCFDCGFGRTCNEATRSCVIDQNSLWDFYVSFAVIPDKDENGAGWDLFNGAPDTFLVAYSSGATTATGRTVVQTDSTFPFWAETPMKGVKAGQLLQNLSFELWDEDPDFDDYIGGCVIPLVTTVFDGSLQSFVCPATASTVSVKLYYRINPHQ